MENAQGEGGEGGGGGGGGGGGTKDSQANTYIEIQSAPAAVIVAATRTSIVLECEAGGHPVPSIHWLKNGRRITQVCNA